MWTKVEEDIFFFFKQKTAYEITRWLEFRRVLFRSPKPQTPNPKPQTPNPKPQTPNPKPLLKFNSLLLLQKKYQLIHFLINGPLLTWIIWRGSIWGWGLPAFVMRVAFPKFKDFEPKKREGEYPHDN